MCLVALWVALAATATFAAPVPRPDKSAIPDSHQPPDPPGPAVVDATSIGFAGDGARTSLAEAGTGGDPVIAAAGDIACDPASSSFNSGNGSASSCRQKYTSDLLANAGLAAVLALGDNQYYCAGYEAFLKSYDLSWGRVKSITYPAVGNHEYLTSGGTGCDSTNAGAAGHFEYFGTAAGDPSKGYYSFDIGSWHIIMLNSHCSGAGGCSATSPQGQWLRNDLASHSNYCTLAFWHVPLFSSGGRASSTYKTFWDALYQYDADVVLNAHDHIYERFAPQTPGGTRDDVRGVRQFTVGTGGSNHTSLVTVARNSEVRNDDTFGVLKLALHPGGYEWEFVPEAGRTFRDSGSGTCHGSAPDTAPPSVPGTLGATAVGGSRVDLSWSASTDDVGVAGYRVFRDGAQIATSATTTYSDRTVQPGTAYLYTVAAYDGAQNTSGHSTAAAVTTGPPDEVLTFAASDDAYVQADMATTNFGAATRITTDENPVRDLLVKYRLTGLAGRQILGAKIRLYCIDSASFGGRFHRLANDSWS